MPVPRDVQVLALLIHGVDCQRGVEELLAAASRLKFGNSIVHSITWLLGTHIRGNPCIQ